MLFPPRELDTCKLTSPHMIENMVPIIAQGQTVRRRRRVASPAIGFIWSTNHPEIAPPFNQHNVMFWSGVVPRWGQVRRYTRSRPYRQHRLMGISGVIFFPSGVSSPWFGIPPLTRIVACLLPRDSNIHCWSAIHLPVSLVLCFVLT